MLKPVRLVILVLMLGSAMFGMAGASAAPSSKAEAAKACQQGSYQNYTRADGTPFANPGDCVNYVAQGSVLKPVPRITITNVSYDQSTTTLEVDSQGTGFAPNSVLIHTIYDFPDWGLTYDPAQEHHGGYTTDANGSFVNGFWLSWPCTPTTGSLTVTDAEGNSASQSFDITC
jgi:hypothetical protein